MRPNREQILEGLVVAALFVGTAWLGRQVHHNYVVHPRTVASAGVAVAPMAVPATTVAGEAAPLAIRDVPRARLLLVMSTDCPFCEENMPEWQHLTGALRAMGDAHPAPVVLSVSSGEETAAYLARHGLQAEVRLIDRAVLPLLGLTGYPATVAVDPSTGAISSWTGVLDDAEHQALLAWAATRRTDISS